MNLRNFVLSCSVLLTILYTAFAAQADDSIESKFLANIRQVTHGFVKAGEGYFSPDERQIIYQAVSKEYPFYQIYEQSLAGDAAPRMVSTGRGEPPAPPFSPDGRHIIYASSHLDPKLDATEKAERDQQAEDARTGKHRRYEWVFDPYTDIYQADLDGSHLHPLTTTYGYDAEGSFSPDGKQIVFCSTRDGNPELYLMDADGSNVFAG